MAIWHTSFPLDEANRRDQACANGHLGIELIEAGDDEADKLVCVARVTMAVLSTPIRY